MFQYSSAKTKKIKYVQFGVLSPDTIRNMSVKEITSDSSYDNNIEIEGGLADRHLGSSKYVACSTCQLKENCPGHFGHIELATPLFHIGFINIVAKILKVVCFSCSKLYIDDAFIKQLLSIKNLSKRLTRILNMSKSIKFCHYCNSKKTQIHQTTEWLYGPILN